MPALDVFVNNAGTNIPEPFVEVSDEHLDVLLGLNVRAAFIAAQAAAKKMIEGKRRGVIINMSSQMGHVGAVNRSVYCLTKHALEGLTKAMALELAPHGIRVVSIAPTFVETPMYQKMKAGKPEFAQWVEARIPLGATGKPEDVAAAVVFAASPAAALVTGTSLVVDGGWTAQ
jgi:NAD(P)-dependent dehydrogenase (short-subunit alcohol dehydrogenase family)